MSTRTLHSHALRRSSRPQTKLKPASQSYLNLSQTGVVAFIFALAALLFATHLWLIRLLG